MFDRALPMMGSRVGGGWLVLAMMLAVVVPGGATDDDWWRTYEDVEFDENQNFDGDSFHLKVRSGSREFDWVIRLYGVDCPETDKRFPSRNAGQAEDFGIDAKEVPAWGRKAARETRDLMRRVKEIRLHVRQDGKEKVRKAAGQAQRYYGLIELIDRDGNSTLLHEELLKEGLARAYGKDAPWPPKDLERHGEEKARERFARDLKRLGHKAKQEEKGVWAG